MMESNANASNKIIPHENDILLGRGGKNNRHSGNERLRNLARTYVDAYTRSTKKGKSNISWDLVQAVRSMKPPGRFLKRDSVSGTWQDVGDDAAREKTSQAMRDAIAASINNHYSFGIHPYTSTTSGNGIDGGRNTGLFPLPTPHGPSRTLTFPTYGGDSLTVPHAYSYPPVMYSSQTHIRPRSSTADSNLVSPENMSRSVATANYAMPKRSLSFSEYNSVLEHHPQQHHQNHHRWTFPPNAAQTQYPRQRLCDEKMLDLDMMKQLNSWDDDDDDDLHAFSSLHGIDYSCSQMENESLFPHAKEQLWKQEG